MGRKPTPPPEAPQRVDLGWAMTFLLIPFTMLGLLVDWVLEKGLRFLGLRQTPHPEPHSKILGCLATIIILPAAIVALLLNLLYGRILLLLAALAYRPRRIAGVFVTSHSPTWSEYIQQKWLEPYAGCFVILNWSERRNWGFGLAPCLFNYFLGEYRNFCPAVIFLRGLRRPLLFRFFYAFRDHKHGDDKALVTLETRLAQELAKLN